MEWVRSSVTIATRTFKFIPNITLLWSYQSIKVHCITPLVAMTTQLWCHSFPAMHAMLLRFSSYIPVQILKSQRLKFSQTNIFLKSINSLLMMEWREFHQSVAANEIIGIFMYQSTTGCQLKLERTGFMASEEMSFEKVDDGRRMPGYTISSPTCLRLKWAKMHEKRIDELSLHKVRWSQC